MNIVYNARCSSGSENQDLEHVLWQCPLSSSKRNKFIKRLEQKDVHLRTIARSLVSVSVAKHPFCNILVQFSKTCHIFNCECTGSRTHPRCLTILADIYWKICRKNVISTILRYFVAISCGAEAYCILNIIHIICLFLTENIIHFFHFFFSIQYYR